MKYPNDVLGGEKLAVGVVVTLFLAFAAAVAVTDGLSFTGTAPSASVVAATVALISGLVASLVALLGILLKHSLDMRAEERLAIEREQNEAARIGVERRLELDAAIRAVDLLSTPGGMLVPPIKIAGALFTLSQLGQNSLAVSLAAELISNSGIHPRVASHVFDRALRSADLDAHGEVASCLLDHTSKFLTASGFEFPSTILHAEYPRTQESRYWLPLTLGELLAVRPLNEWAQLEPAVLSIITGLALAWQTEADTGLRRDIGGLLHVILPIVNHIEFVISSSSKIYLDPLAEEVKNITPESRAAEDLVARLLRWRGNGGLPVGSGRL